MMMMQSARRGLVMLTRRRTTSYHGTFSQIDHSLKRNLSTKNDNGVDRRNNTNRNFETRTALRNEDLSRRRNTGKALLGDFERQVNKLRQRVFRLPKIQPTASLDDVDSGYTSLVHDAQIFVDRLEEAVEKGRLDHRFTREVTFLLQHALHFFRTSYPDCQRVLKLSKRWNLDVANQQPALAAACLAGEWKEASQMFQRLIDPDEAGYAPMEISVREPLGLYAIARHAQENDSPAVAERVMSAVVSMSMVNPTDQNKCTYSEVEQATYD